MRGRKEAAAFPQPDIHKTPKFLITEMRLEFSAKENRNRTFPDSTFETRGDKNQRRMNSLSLKFSAFIFWFDCAEAK